jgi:hypothetical protein
MRHMHTRPGFSPGAGAFGESVMFASRIEDKVHQHAGVCAHHWQSGLGSNSVTHLLSVLIRLAPRLRHRARRRHTGHDNLVEPDTLFLAGGPQHETLAGARRKNGSYPGSSQRADSCSAVPTKAEAPTLPVRQRIGTATGLRSRNPDHRRMMNSASRDEHDKASGRVQRTRSDCWRNRGRVGGAQTSVRAPRGVHPQAAPRLFLSLDPCPEISPRR